MVNFKFAAPTNLDEVFQHVSQFKGKISFLSGGTDLIVQLREGKKKPELVVDISQIPELNYIKEENGVIKIGSATTFSDIATNPLIRDQAGCLSQAASQVGSVQIRNRGTIGGNIASASPAGDSIPVLHVLNAMVTIKGSKEAKRIPINQVVTGAGETSLREDELIIEVDFPALDSQYVSCFEKVGNRTAVTRARVSLAAVMKLENKRKITEARLAVGALGKTAFRLDTVENFLKNKIVDVELAQQFAEILTGVVDTAISGRYSQAYKRWAIQGLGDNIFLKISEQNHLC